MLFRKNLFFCSFHPKVKKFKFFSSHSLNNISPNPFLIPTNQIIVVVTFFNNLNRSLLKFPLLLQGLHVVVLFQMLRQ